MLQALGSNSRCVFCILLLSLRLCDTFWIHVGPSQKKHPCCPSQSLLTHLGFSCLRDLSNVLWRSSFYAWSTILTHLNITREVPTDVVKQEIHQGCQWLPAIPVFWCVFSLILLHRGMLVYFSLTPACLVLACIEVGSPTTVALVFQGWELAVIFFNTLPNNLLCWHLRNIYCILSKNILMRNSYWTAWRIFLNIIFFIKCSTML